MIVGWPLLLLLFVVVVLVVLVVPVVPVVLVVLEKPVVKMIRCLFSDV